MWFKIFNVIGFQAVWLASVYGAGRGIGWLGPVAAIVFVAASLIFSPQRQSDLRMLAIAIPVGFAVDSLFAISNWLNYSSAMPWQNLAPLWIVGMWAGFAVTLKHSLGFLSNQPLAAALFGLIGGPFAYWIAANTFNALQLAGPSVFSVLGALAIAWAIVLPLLYLAERRLQQMQMATA